MIEEVFGFAEIFAVWFYLVVTAFMFVDMLRGGGFMVNLILSPIMVFAAFAWPFTAGMLVIYKFLMRKPEGVCLEHPEDCGGNGYEGVRLSSGCPCKKCVELRQESEEK
jgi:hypothetical protein